MTKQEDIRVNKFISHNTKYSRREADTLIVEGRVTINKKTVKDLSTKVKRDDEVAINDKKVHIQTQYTVIVYNKPKGELVTKNDPKKRKIIYDTLSHKFRHFISAGRLDYASTGVLLLTDSASIANRLTTSNLERVYNIKIRGEIPPQMIRAMQEGIEIDDATAGAHEKSSITSMTFAPFYAYKILKSTPTYSKLRVAITEGKNRELRRFFAFFGNEVVDLNRVSFGGIELNALPQGKSRYLTNSEYSSLRKFLKSE